MLPPFLKSREVASWNPQKVRWECFAATENVIGCYPTCLRKKWLVAAQKKAAFEKQPHSTLSASWMLSKMAHSHSCWRELSRSCQPGALILFHVASPWSLGLKEHGDWIKKGSVPRVGKKLQGSESLASGVVQDPFCHIPLVKTRTVPTQRKRRGLHHPIGRMAKNL